MIIAGALLRRVGRIDGVLAACLVDPATGAEDVVVTLTGHFHVLRVRPVGPEQDLALRASLGRSRANLAMAHRGIRAAVAR